MTKALEFGYTYNGFGDFVNPHPEGVRLNEAGAKFVRGFALVSDYPIVDVQTGFTVERLGPGPNGLMISIHIPTVDGGYCSVAIPMDSDYFLPDGGSSKIPLS